MPPGYISKELVGVRHLCIDTSTPQHLLAAFTHYAFCQTPWPTNVNPEVLSTTWTIVWTIECNSGPFSANGERRGLQTGVRDPGALHLRSPGEEQLLPGSLQRDWPRGLMLPGLLRPGMPLQVLHSPLRPSAAACSQVGGWDLGPKHFYLSSLLLLLL